MNRLKAEGPTWAKIGLHASLATPYHEWREAPWLRLVITDSDEIGRAQAFRLTEEPHVAQLEAAVQQWLQDDTLPTLAHPASYLLALRFSVVGHLLGSFEGIFAPPAQSSVPEVYRSFLLNWWRADGPLYGVGFSCAEFEIEGGPDGPDPM